MFEFAVFSLFLSFWRNLGLVCWDQFWDTFLGWFHCSRFHDKMKTERFTFNQRLQLAHEYLNKNQWDMTAAAADYKQVLQADGEFVVETADSEFEEWPGTYYVPGHIRSRDILGPETY